MSSFLNTKGIMDIVSHFLWLYSFKIIQISLSWLNLRVVFTSLLSVGIWWILYRREKEREKEIENTHHWHMRCFKTSLFIFCSSLSIKHLIWYVQMFSCGMVMENNILILNVFIATKCLDYFFFLFCQITETCNYKGL